MTFPIVTPVDLPIPTEGEFFISRVGTNDNKDFEDSGIEYYGFNPDVTPKNQTDAPEANEYSSSESEQASNSERSPGRN